MLTLCLLVLTASPAPLKVAVPDFSVINVSTESAAFFMDRFANRLRARGLAVTTANEIETVLGLERQKALLGCGETTGCQAEIAAALGADAIVRARLARFGQRFELSLTLIDPADAGVVASFSASAADEGQVLEKLDAAADQLSAKLLGHKQRPPLAGEATAPGPASSGGRSLWPILPLGVGLGAGAFGVVSLVSSFDKVQRIAEAENFEQLGQEARTERGAGLALVGVGVAGLALAGVLFFTGQAPGATPVAVLTPGGAVVGVQGRLP